MPFSILSTDFDLDVSFFLDKKEKLHALMSGKVIHTLSQAPDEGSAFL